MFIHVGSPLVRAWGAKFHGSDWVLSSTPTCLFEVYRWAGGLGYPAGGFLSPTYRSYRQPPAFTLLSDASGDAILGYYLGPEPAFGVRFICVFDADVSARLR